MFKPFLLIRAKYQSPRKYCMPVMSACFVCALLSFCAREFPEKYETQEPGKIIVECTSYAIQIKHSHRVSIQRTVLQLYGNTLFIIAPKLDHFMTSCLVYRVYFILESSILDFPFRIPFLNRWLGPHISLLPVYIYSH